MNHRFSIVFQFRLQKYCFLLTYAIPNYGDFCFCAQSEHVFCIFICTCYFFLLPLQRKLLSYVVFGVLDSNQDKEMG